MTQELEEIRKELMIGVENEDLLYIKMQINKIDTLIHNSKNNNFDWKSNFVQGYRIYFYPSPQVPKGSGMLWYNPEDATNQTLNK
jgi:hypothetical protein